MGEDWVLNHVGMTIENRNATLRHYQALGVGDWDLDGDVDGADLNLKWRVNQSLSTRVP